MGNDLSAVDHIIRVNDFLKYENWFKGSYFLQWRVKFGLTNTRCSLFIDLHKNVSKHQKD